MAWFRSIPTGAKAAIALMTVVGVGISMGSYVTRAEAQVASALERVSRIESSDRRQDATLRRLDRNSWVVCVALSRQLSEIGMRCEQPPAPRED